VVLVRISLAVNARIRDVSTAVVFQFCSAFGVWILAEQLHLSAIITLVVFAMIASRRAPEILPARMRIPAWAVWEVAVFVLNVLAFILVGFQLKAIAANLTPATGARYAAIAVAVCIVVILARIVWVTGAPASVAGAAVPAPMELRGLTTSWPSRRWCGGGRLVRNARHGHARRGPRASGRDAVPRPDRRHRVCRGARHPRRAGAHARPLLLRLD
jgi:hypothetical protein